MRRRELITAVAGTGTLAALAGCTALGSEQNDVTVEDMTVKQVEEDTIRTTGTGSVETDPDKVEFTVSVEAHDRDDADAVVEELAERVEELRDALLEYGIPDDHITTTRYRLRESSRRNRYEGEHRYAVELDDPDAVGEVIDLCVEAGADSIGRINFTISEDRREEFYDEAVAKAVEDARNEAELHANAAGRELGESATIETTKTGQRPFQQTFDLAVAEAADDGAATRIDEGQVAVTAEVTIEYRLE